MSLYCCFGNDMFGIDWLISEDAILSVIFYYAHSYSRLQKECD